VAVQNRLLALEFPLPTVPRDRIWFQAASRSTTKIGRGGRRVERIEVEAVVNQQDQLLMAINMFVCNSL